MNEYIKLPQKKKRVILQKIKETVAQNKNIEFVFVFGSFLDKFSFRDIDVAIYLKEAKKSEIFDKELELSQKIAKNCDLPFDIIDVIILNFAPNSFTANVFSLGELIFCRDKYFLSNLIESVSLRAITNERIKKQSLKELIPS